MTFRALIAALLLAAPPAGGPAVAADCIAGGKRFGQGEFACVTMCGQSRLLRCEMILNNSSWTTVREGCPVSMLATPVPVDVATIGRPPAGGHGKAGEADGLPSIE